MADQAELTRPATREQLQTVNPATGEPGRSYDTHTLEDGACRGCGCAHGLSRVAAHVVSQSARRSSRKAAEILRARKDEFARLMTEEMGKTLDEGRAEVEKCAFHCDWFADHAHEYLADEPADIGGGEAFVTFNPIGVVLAVMPWNFPFWQVFRSAAPALMAGNGMLLKHASNVPGCALAIEEVLHQAGVPTRPVPHSAAAEQRRRSADQGRQCRGGDPHRQRRRREKRGHRRRRGAQEMRARARRRRCVSRARGCRHRAAAKVAATARMVNGGQSCIAGKRFIVVRVDPRAVREGAGRCDARLSRWATRQRKAPSSGRCRASRRATRSTAR